MNCQEITFVFICVFWILCAFIPSSDSNDDNLFPDSLITIESEDVLISVSIFFLLFVLLLFLFYFIYFNK